MNTTAKVLVVDDEPFNLEIMEEYLEEHYANLRFVKDGHECLAAIDEFRPDVILLDVNMPDLSGYQVCEKIRANSDWQNIVVIFVSARGTPEERMMGFEAGGEDYIIKPFKEIELLSKLAKVLDYKSSISNLEVQLDNSENVAFNSMMGNAEMGEAVQYFVKLYECNDIQSVMSMLIGLLQRLDLKACIRISAVDDEHWYSERSSVSPLEKEVMELLSSERIYSFERRIQFNFPPLSVLIKNMPIEDELKLGRVNDLLAIIAEGTANYLGTLKLKNVAQEKQHIENKMAVTDAMVNQVKQIIESVKGNCESGVSDLYHTMDKMLPFMGLEEDQEKLIHTEIDKIGELLKLNLRSLDTIEKLMRSVK